MIGFKLTRRPQKTANAAFSSLQNGIQTGFLIIASIHDSERKKIYGGFKKASDKPTFVPIIAMGNVSTLKLELNASAAEQATLSVWQLLDRGTDVRHMGVSSNWQSKTSPRFVGSRPGAGNKTGLGPAMAGIEKREFDETVNTELEREVEALLAEWIEVGLDEAFA